MTGKEVNFDDVLTMVGDSGKWQYMTFLFTWIEGILIGFHHLSSSFLGYQPDHWCKLDDVRNIPSHWNITQQKEFLLPKEGVGLSKCKMYDTSRLNQINNDFTSALASRGSLDTIPCNNGWDYATDMGVTIVTQWDLVCDRLALLSTVQGSYMGGVFVGCIFWGWASDKFGRRPSILIAAVIQIVSSIVASFAVNYIMFMFFRCLIAFSVSGVFECGFVLVTEIVAPELRTPFGIMTQFPFGIGASLLPLVAYFIKDWTALQLAISVPCTLLITYYWFIPESPRWLIMDGRFEEAKDILKNAAKVNGNPVPGDDELLELIKSLEVKDETAVEN